MAVSQSLTLTEIEVDHSLNSSKVRILWQSTQTGESWNGYNNMATYYVSINDGEETSYNVSYTLPQNSTVTIADKTINVPHKPDGTASITVRTWMYTKISAGLIEKTQSLTLTTIPRPTTLDVLSCDTAYFNGTFTFKYTPKVSSFYNKCYISLKQEQATGVDGYTMIETISLGSNPASQQTYTWTPSANTLGLIYSHLPNSKKSTLRFSIDTCSNSNYTNLIGESEYRYIELTIPDIDDTKPTATMTLTHVSLLSSPFNTLYIKGKSKVSVDLANGEGKHGSSITSYSVSVDGVSATPPYTSGYLLKPGEVKVTGTVTDSRGYSRTYTETISVIDYGPPQIQPASGENEVIVARCDSSGNQNDSGTFLKIEARRYYSKILDKNTCSIRFRYKEEGGVYSDWTTILSATSESNEVDAVLLYVGEDADGRPYGALDVESSYIVQMQAIDAIEETGTTTISVPTERVYMHKAGSLNSLGIGKYVEERNTIDIADDKNVRVRGALLCLEIPPGTDLDTLKKPNRYYGNEEYYAGYQNCPIPEKVTFALEVISLGSLGQTLQRFTTCIEEGTVYERQFFGGFWHEWECVNPPMYEGVEYRTKERYLGKPVYTKMVYLGNLPNATVKEVSHGASATTIIRCLGHLSHGINIPYLHNSEGAWVGIYAGSQKVVITTGSDQSDRTGYAQIWYLKD